MLTPKEAVLVCKRCGHSWIRRNWTRLPKVCPKCKSPYWNRKRKHLKGPNDVGSER